jgi:hypothetical protein
MRKSENIKIGGERKGGQFLWRCWVCEEKGGRVARGGT